jgi:hypothetical protein
MGDVPGNGAGDRIRTGDINLGKVALYQLSYSRPSQTFILALQRKAVKPQLPIPGAVAPSNKTVT